MLLTGWICRLFTASPISYKPSSDAPIWKFEYVKEPFAYRRIKLSFTSDFIDTPPFLSFLFGVYMFVNRCVYTVYTSSSMPINSALSTVTGMPAFVAITSAAKIRSIAVRTSVPVTAGLALGMLTMTALASAVLNVSLIEVSINITSSFLVSGLVWPDWSAWSPCPVGFSWKPARTHNC